MTELITKEDIEKYSSAIYMDCSICGEDTKMILHDGSPVCDECLLSIMSSENERLVPDMEERLNKIAINGQITIEQVRASVSAFFGLSENDFERKTRNREIVMMRQCAHVIAKLTTKMSLSYIGIKIGNKDHSTVLHSIKTVKNLYDTDRVFRLDFKQLLDDFKCADKFKEIKS